MQHYSRTYKRHTQETKDTYKALHILRKPMVYSPYVLGDITLKVKNSSKGKTKILFSMKMIQLNSCLFLKSLNVHPSLELCVKIEHVLSIFHLLVGRSLYWNICCSRVF